MRIDIETKSLGEICDVRDGTHDSPKYLENGFYLLTSKNFSSGKISYEGANKISIEDYNAINKRSKVDIGDIVMPMIGTIGSPVIISQEPNFAIKNVALIKRNENVCMNYICAFLASSSFEKAIKSSKRGGTQKFVSLGDLRNLKLPLPPIAEQKRIAEILDRTQSLISKRKEAIAKLDTLTQSIFLEMFGDPVTNKMGFDEMGIENICDLIVDCVNRTAPVVDYPTNFKMIRTSNVKNGKVNLDDVRYVTEETFQRWNRRAIPCRNDVLLTREAPVGEAGIIDSDEFVFLGQRLMLYRVNPKYLTPQYLLFAFRSSFLQQQFTMHGAGSTVKHLSLPACRSFRLLVPPLPLQKEFAQRVESVEKLKATHRASLSQLEALFASLQHRAFRGEL